MDVEESNRLTCRVGGMDCAECAKKIEKAVGELEGVKQVRVSYTLGKLSVEGNVSQEELSRTLKRLGYTLEGEEIGYKDFFSLKNRRLVATAASGVLFALGAFSDLVLHQPYLYYPLYIAGILVGGYHIARRAIASAQEKYLDMNVLMIVAVAGAVIIGAWEEATAIVFLFSTAEMLESFSIARTRRSISALMDFAPSKARVLRDGREDSLDVTDLAIGDVIVVRPGERIPTDGEVIKGRTSVDESAVTGESVPAAKEEGDPVYGGTLNTSGSLEVRVSKKFQDTILSKIVELVEEAELKKAPTERFIDRFSRFYTPAVVSLALVVMFVPFLVFNDPFDTWFYRGLVLLVISCPCALVISTPVSVVSAISGGAKNGVLFKGGLFLERMGQIKVVGFDKTGTLTQGRPRVEEIIPFGVYSEREVLRIAASAENLSEHHLARAVIERASKEKVEVAETQSFEAISGKGVSVIVLGKQIFAGSPQFFRELCVDLSPHEGLIEEKNKEGKTVILIGSAQELMGLITIRDIPREGAKGIIDQLKAMGIKVVMLTGDDTLVAEKVAKELGIEEFQARLLPTGKVKAVDQYQQRYGPMVMIGDGINDAPALAEAEVGVAMGVAGTDIALETADVALMSDDLKAVLYGIKLSRKATAVIKENVGVALGVKLLFTVLAIPGLITLWIAILIGDLGVSFGVISNAYRLHRFK